VPPTAVVFPLLSHKGLNMTTESTFTRRAAPAADQSHQPGQEEVEHDYYSALRELLEDTGLTEAELDRRLDSIAQKRGSRTDHLGFEEVRDFGTISAERQQHAESCEYCQDLLACCFDSNEISQLARKVARNIQAGSRAKQRGGFRLGIALGVLALLAAGFLLGFEAASSQLKSSHEEQPLQKELASNSRIRP